MITAALKNNAAKTVYRNNSDTHYTRIDNKTLRLKIPGDIKITAHSILMYALSCQSDWVITVNSLSNFFDVPESTIRKKLTLLSKAGLAKSVAITHPRSKKIIRHQWIFYESPPKPLHRITRSGKKDENAQPPKQNHQKNHCTKLSAVAPIIENKQPREETTPTPAPGKPPKPPEKTKAEKAPAGAVVDLSKIRKLINREISFRIKDATLRKKCSGVSEKHIAWASNEAMAKGNLNKVGYFLTLMGVEMIEQVENGLKIHPIPTNIDGSSEQMKKIMCYNRNVTNTTCTVIKGVGVPTNECRMFCPYCQDKGL